jgi:hypothetical protein
MILSEFIVERNGRYQGRHSLDVTEHNGRFYGESRVDEGYQVFTTWYGMDYASCSNLDLRDDGFKSRSDAFESLKKRFNVIASGGGYAVIGRERQ